MNNLLLTHLPSFSTGQVCAIAISISFIQACLCNDSQRVQCCAVSKSQSPTPQETCKWQTPALMGFSLLASTPVSHAWGCEFESGAGLPSTQTTLDRIGATAGPHLGCICSVSAFLCKPSLKNSKHSARQRSGALCLAHILIPLPWGMSHDSRYFVS